MLRCLPWFVVLFVVAALRGQDASAVTERENKLVLRAATGLHTLADAYQAQRQHARALALRRELWLEYAEDDEKARDKCGFTKVGDTWRIDATKLVIDKNLTGDAKVTKKIDQELAKLEKELLAEHKALAALWGKLGEETRAMRHWRRVLRFAPADQQAAQALAMARFEDFNGSAMELGMLRRARSIRGAVDWLLRKQFEVQKIEGRSQPLFEKAQIGHHGFRTEHFQIWGTLPEAQLLLVAQHVERALLLAYTLLGTSEGAPFVPARRLDILLVADDDSYGKVLDLCADQFDPARMQFLKTDVDMAFLKEGDHQLRLYKTNGSDAEALDQTVRGVVQDAVGVWTDGLWEGIGHAACGFMFGRTLTFLLEQKSEQTVASGSQKLLMPDMAVWMEIAQQSAWSKSDTRTSELVLISAAKFSTEQRVKAWAICDYLFHWRPELLRELDKSQNKEIKSPPDVEAEFLRRTKLSLPQIDHEWREFWAKSDALRKAMAADPLGEPKGKDRPARLEARAVVDAVNEQRTAAMRGPVGFHLAGGPDVQAALTYGDLLVKAEQEQAKDPKQKVALPVAPPAIGRTVLWSRRSTAAEAVSDWCKRPSWRDALVHPGRGLFGSSKGKTSFVLDLVEVVLPARTGLPLGWPRHHQLAVPGRATVAELGPRAITALAAAGKKPADVVGMPLSLHFGRAISDADLAAVQATVFAASQRAEGVIVCYQAAGPDGAGPDDDSADGCVAWIALEPFAPGVEVEIAWTVPKKLLAEHETFRPFEFTIAK